MAIMVKSLIFSGQLCENDAYISIDYWDWCVMFFIVLISIKNETSMIAGYYFLQGADSTIYKPQSFDGYACA